MSREREIRASSNIEAQSDEGDRLSRKRKFGMKEFCFVVLLSCITTAALVGITFISSIKFVAPHRQIRFSIISASTSGLDPNGMQSSPPVLRIVFQAERASEDSLETCFCHSYTDFSYDGVTVSKKDSNFCYNMEQASEFVLPIPLYREDQSRNLREKLWEERETVIFNLLMHFDAGYLPSNIYNVSCTNLRLGAPDVPVPCETSMKVKPFE